ncbi:MAG: O-antigen ligase family protein [Verrucomicrobiaceae bacterium]|nr:O-antigen ligase family protein [Verrucomicrobiaceae bacterium]
MIEATGRSTSSATRWTLPEMAMAAAVALLLTGSFSGAVFWGYEHGGFPLKPRDFNIALTLVVLALLPFNRPRFSLPALALLTLPLGRVLDAAFLRRYVQIEFGAHSVYALMLVGYLIISIAAVLSLATSKGRQTAILVAAAAIVVNSAMNLYEYLGFASFTRITGRMAGFHIDPNHSPIIMCLMLGILYTVNTRYWWNMALALVAAVGIALTMSRSGMAVFAGMTALYVLLHFREHKAGMITLAAVAVPLLAVGIGILGATSTKQGLHKNEDTAGRMEAIFSGDFEKVKSPERAKDLADGWEAVTRRPITGYGTGAGDGGDTWQPHNMFVTQWIDMGLFGLLQFAFALLATTAMCMAKKFRGGFCLMPVWLFIPCSQVLMETPAYWYCFAVAAMVVFPRRYSLSLRGRESSALPQQQVTLHA